MWKVFLSSTSRDLSAHRSAVLRAIRKMDGFHCHAMEDFGARHASPLEFCRSSVQKCDVFVGILAGFYGSCPPESDVSYTEHEYETALSIGLPLLMFLSPEDAPLPGDLPQSPADAERQRHFRERAQAGRIREIIGTPEELATAVVAALHNFARARTAPDELPAAGETARRTDRGVLVPKLCDRAQQEEQFRLFLAHHTQQGPPRPLAVFLRGAPQECLESLVHRFCGTALRKLAERHPGSRTGAVDEPYLIDWPVDGPPEARLRMLLERVFEAYECDDTPADDDPAAAARALLEIVRRRLRPVVPLQIRIPLRRWDRPALACLQRFLGFWDLVGQSIVGPRDPRFLLFIQLSYPELRGWRRWFFRPGRLQRRLLAVLNRRHSAGEKVNPSCPTLHLGELAPVDREDVLTWFQRHRLFGERRAEWVRRRDGIFGDREKLPMMEIEAALHAIYEEHHRTPRQAPL
jgi:hypothetical protein